MAGKPRVTRRRAFRSDFVHLHNHSDFSLTDGMLRLSDAAGLPSDFLKGLSRSGVRAIALTDHGNLYGALEFYGHCRRLGIKPIIGCEFYLARGSRFDRAGTAGDGFHLTVLARDYEGYQNLLALSSAGFLEGLHHDPRIDRDLLAKHSKGLIVLSGCLKGEIPQAILAGGLEGALDLVGLYRDIVEPGCFFLEIMDHGLERQRQVTRALIEIGARTGLPLVATNDCHYPGKADARAHDVRLCISAGCKLSSANRLKFESPEFYFKTAAEMHKLFSFAPEALANTLKIADMCDVSIPMDRMLVPEFPVPAGFTQDSYLERLCQDGLKRLGRDTGTYRERLRYELDALRRSGLSGHILMIWDLVGHAGTNGVPVGPGRGAAPGSLVSCLLGITSVDPIEHSLLFERFLRPDRKCLPAFAFEIDVSDWGRERVIEYLRRKYGESHIARIGTFSRMAGRWAMRDVGRALGIAPPKVEKLAKLIPIGADISTALKTSPELRRASKGPEAARLLEIARKLAGLKRSIGVHASGLILAGEPAVSRVPLARQPETGLVFTQYDGDVLPWLGLLPFSLLGLRTLSMMEHAVKAVCDRRVGATPFREFLAAIPLTDPKVYALLGSGDTRGVFQFDSDGIRALLRRAKPSCFSDTVALLALYRPGPMTSGLTADFVERRLGLKPPLFGDALVEPLVRETYGCIVYQEQVMAISKAVAGFTPGQAESLRRAIGRQAKAALAEHRRDFVSGCAKRGVGRTQARELFARVAAFGRYAFLKAHATAYGLLAYQTAWLKANHPDEFEEALKLFGHR
ncbi:MAG: DNA polymerase III subunit alpha [Elusimicrobia bacterium]|nr:DNA polymerase III subunit alpha [Elusimicrobiota bacterium]